MFSQNVGQRDYVVHLARTPCPASKDVKDESAGDAAQSLSKVEHLKPLKSVLDIQDIWVADHAEHVSNLVFIGIYIKELRSLNKERLKEENGRPHTYLQTTNEANEL